MLLGHLFTTNCQVIAYDASRIAQILCCACIVTNYSQKLGWYVDSLQVQVFNECDLVEPPFQLYFSASTFCISHEMIK